MDWGEIILTLILDLILTVFFYLLVPVIFCIRKKTMTQKQIKKVVIINGVCVCLFFGIIAGRVTAAVFLWSWVGKKIMEKALLVNSENAELKEDPNRVYECKSCCYRNRDYFEVCPICGNRTKRYAYLIQEKTPETENKQTVESSITPDQPENNSFSFSQTDDLQATIDIPIATNNKISFCRKCGNKLQEDSRYCSKCGTNVITNNHEGKKL